MIQYYLSKLHHLGRLLLLDTILLPLPPPPFLLLLRIGTIEIVIAIVEVVVMVILGILVLPPLPIPIIHLLLQLLLLLLLILLLLLVIIVTIKNGIIGIMEVFGVRRNYPMRREITSGIATDPIDFLGGAGTPLEEEEDQVVEVIDIIIPQVIPGITILLPLLLLHLPLGIAIVIIVIAIIIGIIILLPLLLPHPPLGIVIVIIIGM